MELIPVYLIFTPIIFSLIIYLFQNKYINYLVFIVQILLIILSINYYFFIESSPNLNSIIIGGWHERIGILLKNDTLSFTFIFLTIFMWSVIILYCFDKRKEDSKFLFFLLFLEGAFLALIQSNDLFNLFILIEIITIISTILIIYKKDGYSVRAGIYYLLFNSVGLIFYLLGTILVYNTFGTLNIDLIKEGILSSEGNQTILTYAYIFFITAISVKSAIFPLFTWLPRAHGAAPSSISGLLSGLIVKLGIIVFIRIQFMFSNPHFNTYIFIIGTISALIGIVYALSQKDIKKILAYHTISQIGIIIIGISNTKTFHGGILHLINHALFKSLLFLGVGIIIRNYNVRRVTEIRGVFKNLPITSIFLIIGMFSITGAPFFNGYVSKSIIGYGYDSYSIQSIFLYLINLGTAVSFIKFSQIFFGKVKIKKVVKINEYMSLFLLASACLFIGLFYQLFNQSFFNIDLSHVNLMKIGSFINYLIILALGYIFYKKIVDKDIFILKIIRHSQISFETSNYLLVLYFISLILWNYLFI